MLYLVISSEQRIAKNGSTFYSTQLYDGVSTISANIFAQDFAFPMSVIEANLTQRGEFVNISGFAVVADLALDPQGFEEYPQFSKYKPVVPTTSEVLTLFKEFISEDKSIAFAERLVTGLCESYKVAYGAKKMHHAYAGGLLQHTYEVLKILKGFMSEITFTDPIRWDLCAWAALFHDYGKLWEYSTDGNYTESIALTPHPFISANEAASALRELYTGNDLQVLQHIILSHHGSCGVVPPACVEAVLVSHADMLSGLLNNMKNTDHMQRSYMGDKATVIKVHEYVK